MVIAIQTWIRFKLFLFKKVLQTIWNIAMLSHVISGLASSCLRSILSFFVLSCLLTLLLFRLLFFFYFIFLNWQWIYTRMCFHTLRTLHFVICFCNPQKYIARKKSHVIQFEAIHTRTHPNKAWADLHKSFGYIKTTLGHFFCGVICTLSLSFTSFFIVCMRVLVKRSLLLSSSIHFAICPSNRYPLIFLCFFLFHSFFLLVSLHLCTIWNLDT